MLFHFIYFRFLSISCGLLLLLCGESVFVNVECLCACLCFDLDISFVFFALNLCSDFVWTSSSFVLEKAFWFIFGVCVVSFYFLRFPPQSDFVELLSFFCIGRSFLVDVEYSICVVSFYFLRF